MKYKNFQNYKQFEKTSLLLKLINSKEYIYMHIPYYFFTNYAYLCLFP
ncbi:hypothetical protein NM3144_2100 [Neisseria meningitidis NM3144]|nr:hypothetical protein NM3144_2100 [Neisseria meningitidis NM3144]